jgi:hypothetical protein
VVEVKVEVFIGVVLMEFVVGYSVIVMEVVFDRKIHFQA